MGKKRTEDIQEILLKPYPNQPWPLAIDNAFELLIATTLSAQCTDVRVNQITRRLFARAAIPEEMLSLGVDGVRELIHGCGLHNNKAKNIIATCHDLV